MAITYSNLRFVTKKPKVYPSRKLDQFVIRLPDGMREKLAEIAARNNRSMNAEIVSGVGHWIDRQSVKPKNDAEFDPILAAFHSINLIADEVVSLQDIVKDHLKKK